MQRQPRIAPDVFDPTSLHDGYLDGRNDWSTSKEYDIKKQLTRVAVSSLRFRIPRERK
jgi:hypothetical protein